MIGQYHFLEAARQKSGRVALQRIEVKPRRISLFDFDGTSVMIVSSLIFGVRDSLILWLFAEVTQDEVSFCLQVVTLFDAFRHNKFLQVGGNAIGVF